MMRIPSGDAYIAVASAGGAPDRTARHFNLIAPPRVYVPDYAEHLR